MSPAICSSCDGQVATTPQGLCDPCHGSLVFITRPAAHRELWRRTLASQHREVSEWEQRGVFVIDGPVPADNTDWVCDLCNDPIPVHGEHTLIPLAGSYAICPPCTSRFEYWPDAWTHPTPRACPCGACQLPLQRQALLDRIAHDLHPGRSHDREIGR